MKAVVFHEFGGPDVLAVEEVPDPQPGQGEVALEILACALNHLDVDIREGISRFPVEATPASFRSAARSSWGVESS